MNMAERNNLLVALQHELKMVIDIKVADVESTTRIQFTQEEIEGALAAVALASK